MSAPAPEPGVYVLHLEGENDARTADRVRYDLAAAVDAGTPLILDLSGATSLDRTVMALLVDGVRRCEDAERACLLLLPETSPPQVRSRFDFYGLTSLLPVVRSWEEALRRAAPLGARQQPAH